MCMCINWNILKNYNMLLYCTKRRKRSNLNVCRLLSKLIQETTGLWDQRFKYVRWKEIFYNSSVVITWQNTIAILHWISKGNPVLRKLKRYDKKKKRKTVENILVISDYWILNTEQINENFFNITNSFIQPSNIKMYYVFSIVDYDIYFIKKN